MTFLAQEYTGESHPSVGEDIKGFRDLTEPIRRYLLAFRVKNRSETDEPVSPNGEEPRKVFGVDAIGKKKPKKKRKTPFIADEKLVTSMHSGGLDTSDRTMAKLCEEAAAAIAAAQQLAGEPVSWCCGLLRITSRIDYECECEQRPEVREIGRLATT